MSAEEALKWCSVEVAGKGSIQSDSHKMIPVSKRLRISLISSSKRLPEALFRPRLRPRNNKLRLYRGQGLR